jgi:hypothetical protein
MYKAVGFGFVYSTILVFGVFAAGGGERWASQDDIVYEGNSEISFSYTGPNNVKVKIYDVKTNEAYGSINTGDSARLIIADGNYSFEARPVAVDSSSNETESQTGSKRLDISVKSQKAIARIKIEYQNSVNTVTEYRITQNSKITPQIPPQKLSIPGTIDKRLFTKTGEQPIAEGIAIEEYKLKDTAKFTSDILITGVNWDEVLVFALDGHIAQYSCIKKNISQEEYTKTILSMLLAFHIKGLGDKPPSPEYGYTEEVRLKDGAAYRKPGTSLALIPFYDKSTREGGYSVTANINVLE